MKKAGLYGYVFDFIVGYRPIPADKILDIQKCLIEKNNLV